MCRVFDFSYTPYHCFKSRMKPRHTDVRVSWLLALYKWNLLHFNKGFELSSGVYRCQGENSHQRSVGRTGKEEWHTWAGVQPCIGDARVSSGLSGKGERPCPFEGAAATQLQPTSPLRTWTNCCLNRILLSPAILAAKESWYWPGPSVAGPPHCLLLLLAPWLGQFPVNSFPIFLFYVFLQ